MTKNKRIDVMVDLETLGTDLDALVFQVASAAFDINTGEITNEFNECADVAKAVEKDGKIDGGTLKWWLGTNSELFRELLNKDAQTPSELIVDYFAWISKLTQEYDEVYLWGNGILFDNAILRYKFTQQGLHYPIFFRNDRDVRTILELASSKEGVDSKILYGRFYNESLTAHDAYNDVVNQIALVVGCYGLLTKGDD